MFFSHTATRKISEENLNEGIAVQQKPVLRDIFVLSANVKVGT